MINLVRTSIIYFFVILTCSVYAVVGQETESSAKIENKIFAVSTYKPAYPVKAIIERVEGEVKIDIEIDNKGKVTKATIISGDKLFAKTVEYAALKWRFNEFKGNTIPRTAQLVFAFHLSIDDYKETDLEELKYKLRLDIYNSIIADCFNNCGS